MEFIHVYNRQENRIHIETKDVMIYILYVCDVYALLNTHFSQIHHFWSDTPIRIKTWLNDSVMLIKN